MITQSQIRDLILSESLKAATEDYKAAKALLSKANNGKARKSYAMRELNKTRTALRRIANAVNQYYYS